MQLTIKMLDRARTCRAWFGTAAIAAVLSGCGASIDNDVAQPAMQEKAVGDAPAVKTPEQEMDDLQIG